MECHDARDNEVSGFSDLEISLLQLKVEMLNRLLYTTVNAVQDTEPFKKLITQNINIRNWVIKYQPRYKEREINNNYDK